MVTGSDFVNQNGRFKWASLAKTLAGGVLFGWAAGVMASVKVTFLSLSRLLNGVAEFGAAVMYELVGSPALIVTVAWGRLRRALEGTGLFGWFAALLVVLGILYVSTRVITDG